MMQKPNYMKLEVYQIARELAKNVWNGVIKWNYLPKSTIGMQVIRSADSIAANLAEGSGKSSTAEKRRYARIARGSLMETIHWIDLAVERRLISAIQHKNIQEISSKLMAKLNNYIKVLGKRL